MSNTNNLVSNIKHGMVNRPDPAVGLGVTICIGSDRYVGTIKRIMSPDLFVFTRDDVKAAPKNAGMGHQDWVYTPQPDGDECFAKRGKDGRWYEAHKTPKGNWSISKRQSPPILVGEKDYYYDWSF